MGANKADDCQEAQTTSESTQDSEGETSVEDMVWCLLAGSADAEDDDAAEEERIPSVPRPLLEGVEALRAEGICRLPVPLEAIEELESIATALLETKAWSTVRGTESGEEVALDSSWPLLRLHYSIGARHLFWLYAGDAEALEPFGALAEVVAPSLAAVASAAAGQLYFAAASLVVLCAPGARASEVHPHRDWEERALGPRSAFTVLTPLVLPAGSAGLEIFGPDKRSDGVAQYVRGEAIAFDNKLLHRTAPGSSPTRVLASLSFAPSDPKLWPVAEKVLRAQTPHFYQRPLDV
mmetsp:Transcript_125302/g.243971  ORF Transcript_125302/g.243971 Transcript_125302/m.243971 type:complete len:294 (+) Transcript_125302:154-1035(+)|eukprot:CAMPEP_0172662708 /NCGR_PEP_ID=MMETSP1074-20121228/5507_1 /TAXON_ID=2916 /ORGANISM="Ceratium fusus, Strain PA161109" /LENGTH=293 /DNA_ID=CAMNT_0013478639 /DNA_START=147 /DNA_END=1028 /DNA_ORIENTATION=+